MLAATYVEPYTSMKEGGKGVRQGAWRWAKSAGGGSGAGRGLALGERVVVVVFTGPDVAELWRFHELEGGCCHLRKTIQTSEFGARRGEGNNFALSELWVCEEEESPFSQNPLPRTTPSTRV